MSDLQQGSPVAPKTGKSGAAIAGLVAGIVALVMSPLPIINNIAIFVALVGLVLGIFGMRAVKKGASGKGMAVASVVVSVIAVVVVLGSQAFYGAALDAVSESLESPSVSSGSSQGDGNGADAGAADAGEPTSNPFEVSIDEGTVVQDYEGNPALSVTYTWVNTSDEATSFAVEAYPKCFQDGIQLDTAVVSGAADSNYATELKPGASVQVTLAYSLNGESDVTVEVGPVINVNDVIWAEKTFSVA